jgi:hypothetical protein
MIPATKIQYETPEGHYYHLGDDLHFISREEIDAVERSGKNRLQDYATTPTIWPADPIFNVTALIQARPGQTELGGSPPETITLFKAGGKSRESLTRTHLMGARTCPRTIAKGSHRVAKGVFASLYTRSKPLCTECVAYYLRHR